MPVIEAAPSKGLALPPPPDAALMKLFNEDKRSNISGVKLAIPHKIEVRGKARILPPPPPSNEMLKMFFQDQREKITDVRSSMPSVMAAGPPPPPPPAHFAVKAIPEISEGVNVPAPPPPPPPPTSEALSAFTKVRPEMKYYYQYNQDDIDLKSLTDYPN